MTLRVTFALPEGAGTHRVSVWTPVVQASSACPCCPKEGSFQDLASPLRGQCLFLWTGSGYIGKVHESRLGYRHQEGSRTDQVEIKLSIVRGQRTIEVLGDISVSSHMALAL